MPNNPDAPEETTPQDYDEPDWDPAAPKGAARATRDIDPEFEKDRNLANYGEAEPTIEPAEEEPLDDREARATRAVAPTMPIDGAKARVFLDACINSNPRVTYGLGKKVPFHGAKPGQDFKKVDCSGFVREAIWRATNPPVNFKDGSVVQHDWIRAQGFATGTREEAMASDNVVRIVFLRQQDSPSGIGHVALVHNGRTIESHGGTGPNSRAWTVTGWQTKAFVYRLTKPA